MPGSSSLRVIYGAREPVGAHVARALLSRQREAVVFDPRTEQGALRTGVTSALEAVAWASCEPFDATLLAGVRWVGEGDSLESIPGVHEWWHLEDYDLAEASARSEHAGRLLEALRHARQMGCRRFVYLSSIYADGEAERAVASFCAEAGLASTILRPSMVVGPFATLRLTGAAASLEPLRRWLRPLLASAPASAPPSDSIVVNLLPVDRFVEDVGRIIDTDFAGLPVCDLPSGEDLLVRFITEPVADDRELLPLGPSGCGVTVAVQKSSLPRSLPAHLPLSTEAGQAHIEALVRELRGASVRSVFAPGVGAGADGTPLVTYECGADSSRPVVLINAFGMPVEFWVTVGAQLARSFRVLTWETGGVPSPSGRRDAQRTGPAAHAEDLACLLDERGIGKTDIVAWCNGAQVALAFASAFPERVGRLVFVGGTFQLEPAVPYTEYARLLIALAYNASQSPRNANMLSDVMRRQESVAAPQPAKDRIASAHLRQLCRLPYRTGDLLFRYASGIKQFAEARISTISVSPGTRALVITGGRDNMVNQQDPRWVASQIPGATLVEVAEADHMGLYDTPRIAATVLEFLERTAD